MSGIQIEDIAEYVPLPKRVSIVKPDDATGFDFQSVRSVFLDKLADPLNYPPLSAAIIPGDQICFVVEPGLPCVTELLLELVRQVSGIVGEHGSIVILFSEGTSDRFLCQMQDKLKAEGFGDVQCRAHESGERDHLGFLAPSQSGEPILLNACLTNADFVIPVGYAKAGGWKRGTGFIYPYFSDQPSRTRFFKMNSTTRRAMIREVTHWLGTTFAIVVVSANGVSIDDFLIGNQGDAERLAVDRLAGCAPDVDNELSAELVIAEVGEHSVGSYEEVAELIASVRQWCVPRGSCVVLWNDDRQIEGLEGALDREEFTDANQMLFVATHQNAIKKLGCGQVDDLAEIKRLIDRHASCLCLKSYHITQSVYLSMVDRN